MIKEIKAVKRLMPLIKIYPWAVPLITILGVLSSLSEGIGISMLAPLLESLNNTNNATVVTENTLLKLIQHFFNFIPTTNRPLVILAIMVIMILAKAFFTYAHKLLSYWWATNIEHQLRCQIMTEILQVKYSFFEESTSARLMNIISNCTLKASEALVLFSKIIINLCTLIIFGIILLLISLPMTLGVSFSLVIVSRGLSFLTKPIQNLSKKNVRVNSSMYNSILGIFYGMKTVRIFGREDYENERFTYISRQVRKNLMHIELFASSVEPVFELLSVVILVSILAIAIKISISIPTMLTFIFMLYRLQPQMSQMDVNRMRLVGLYESIQEIFNFIHHANQQRSTCGQVILPTFQQGITFKQVAFRYNPKENNIIEDFSLCIPQGKTTAFVGSSGAGKTTIINLICRFYDVTDGNIYVDDYPIQDLQLDAWRQKIALVSQNIHIFSASVRDNIAYARLDATLAEIEEATILANADEFIAQLPQGYDTIIGDEGISLSGGQQQRIAIARAILKNAEIVILDEATNALDSVSESLIQASIKKLSKNRTVIIIAHRLSTIEHADQIVVMDKGKIVEQGNLQELLELNKFFAKLYRVQNVKQSSN